MNESAFLEELECIAFVADYDPQETMRRLKKLVTKDVVFEERTYRDSYHVHFGDGMRKCFIKKRTDIVTDEKYFEDNSHTHKTLQEAKVFALEKIEDEFYYHKTVYEMLTQEVNNLGEDDVQV